MLDRTVTPLGARLLRDCVTRPLLDVAALEERLDHLQAFVDDGLLRADVRALLKGLPDLERLTNRVLSGRASPRDLDKIGRPSGDRARARGAAEQCPAPAFAPLADALDPCPGHDLIARPSSRMRRPI